MAPARRALRFPPAPRPLSRRDLAIPDRCSRAGESNRQFQEALRFDHPRIQTGDYHNHELGNPRELPLPGSPERTPSPGRSTCIRHNRRPSRRSHQSTPVASSAARFPACANSPESGVPRRLAQLQSCQIRGPLAIVHWRVTLACQQSGPWLPTKAEWDRGERG